MLRGVGPGIYPRGGKTHLRIWLAERLADEAGVLNLAGAPALKLYARALGVTVGKDVDLHSVPPVTGLLSLGAGCSVEAEVDLAGYWLDGDVAARRAASRSARTRASAPGAPCAPARSSARRPRWAPARPSSERYRPGEYWSGGPAARVAESPAVPGRTPFRRTGRAGSLAYAASALLISLLPLVAVLCGLLAVSPWLRGTTSVGDAFWTAAATLPLATVVGLVVLALLVVAGVRLLAIGLEPGHHPVHGRLAWQAWSTLRLLDESRGWLYPLYASTVTPAVAARLGCRDRRRRSRRRRCC